MTTPASDGATQTVSDDPQTCVCGDPSALNTVHRSDGPCHVVGEVVDTAPTAPAASVDGDDNLPAVKPSTEVAAVAKWPHEVMDFNGDKIGIRVPTPQAMSALSMGMGKYVPNKVKNDITGLFIARHLSPESYEHVYSRLMDPDDDGYNANTIGEIMGAILEAGVKAFEEAKKAADDEAKK